MELSRNQEHFIIMTVIYNELTDFTFGEGKLVRSANEIISSMCSEASPFVIDSIMISLQKYVKTEKNHKSIMTIPSLITLILFGMKR